MTVSCVLGQNQRFQPIDRNQLDHRGVSLEPPVAAGGADAPAH
jgi:hypothetical protein